MAKKAKQPELKVKLIEKVECKLCKTFEPRSIYVGYCQNQNIRTVVPIDKIGECVYYK